MLFQKEVMQKHPNLIEPLNKHQSNFSGRNENDTRYIRFIFLKIEMCHSIKTDKTKKAAAKNRKKKKEAPDPMEEILIE
jgi:hypothetical protein